MCWCFTLRRHTLQFSPVANGFWGILKTPISKDAQLLFWFFCFKDVIHFHFIPKAVFWYVCYVAFETWNLLFRVLVSVFLLSYASKCACKGFSFRKKFPGSDTPNPWPILSSSVNLLGILGGRKGGSKGLVRRRGGMWEGYPCQLWRHADAIWPENRHGPVRPNNDIHRTCDG